MTIQQYLKKYPLIFDGSMGTYYTQLHKDVPDKCELINLNNPQAIKEIHEEYIKAGAKAIKTNTFAANRFRLELEQEVVQEVITAGYNLACEAAKDRDVFVFADIGPIQIMETEETFDEYIAIIDCFLNLGATNFLFETFGSDEYLSDICEYIKGRNPDAFIIVEFAVSPDGFTRLGLSGKQLFNRMNQCKYVDGIGFNCISGPHHLLQYINQFSSIGDKYISIMPNAGYPTVVDNRTFFQNSAEYFATQMMEIYRKGVKILGGCCGTTPEFISKMVKSINDFSLYGTLVFAEAKTENEKESKGENILIEKINGGKKIIAVELDPPLDANIDFFMKSAEKLKNLNVDAITIADCPIARARVDSSLLACKLKRELGISPIPHMTCRDRNINATKALLLGLNIEGVNNVLVVTGDPIPSAQRDEVKSIFQFNSAILANHIRTLNETVLETPFQISGALNINAVNFENQLKHAKRKMENGVSMFLTQPVLSQEAIENLKKAKEVLPAKILGGIMPVVSYRNACFMNNEISGINVSDEVAERYKDISKEEATELAIEISGDFINKISDYVDGYYIITPFKRIDIIEQIIKNIKR